MSIVQYTVWSLLYGMIGPLVLVLVLAGALSALLASRISKRVVEPLNSLDLDNPLENDVFEELSPLLLRIEQQHRYIGEQMSELRTRQDEFSAVTSSMREGLILLSDKGLVLSINSAAMHIFGTSQSCIGRDMLTVERSTAMQNLVSQALCGTAGDAVFDLLGARYRVEAGPVWSDGKLTGVCILAFDITRQENAEKQRREFTANVSQIGRAHV